MNILEKGFEKLKKILEYFAAVSLAGMMILISLQVLFRYVLSSPLAWTEELARFTFIWMTFIASALAAVNSEHVAITMFEEKLKGTAKAILIALSNLLSSMFFATAAYFSIEKWGKLGMQTSAALKIPMNMIYLGIIIGCMIMFLWYLSRSVKAVSGMIKKN